MTPSDGDSTMVPQVDGVDGYIRVAEGGNNWNVTFYSFTRDDLRHSDEVHILRDIASDQWKAVSQSCIPPSCLRTKLCSPQTRRSLCSGFQPG